MSSFPLNVEGNSLGQSDQQSHQWNRPTPASMFECHVHPNDHDAEVFVLIITIFGVEAVPVCLEAAEMVKEKSRSQHGVRDVSDEILTDYRGTISGVLSTR